MSCKRDALQFEYLYVSRSAHHLRRQVLLDPFTKVIASPNGLYRILSAAVACGALEPDKRGGAVAFEVLGKGNVCEFLRGESIEGAGGVPVVPSFVADACEVLN